MNYAFVDASWQEQVPGPDLGGWGAVLIKPGELQRRFQGQLNAPDNNAAELCAVLETVRAAPEGEPLTVYTDNQTVIALVSRGRGPYLLSDLTREIHDLAQERQIKLRAKYAPRSGRHMLTAHELANEARRGQWVPEASPGSSASPQAELLLEHRPAVGQARISLRRWTGGGQAVRVSTQFSTDQHSEVPPSVQVLLAALQLAQPGEALTIRRASRVAQALWQKPERALRPAVHAALSAARNRATKQDLEIFFLGSE